MAFEKYHYYFDIDPDYTPCINDEVINKNPNIWKKFFPHETFIKLINNTVSVLQRKQKLSIWVEGAYGTGKSHAVLTLKKLLDASENDTKEYFDTYKLSHDLFNKLQTLKVVVRFLLFIGVVLHLLIATKAFLLLFRKVSSTH